MPWFHHRAKHAAPAASTAAAPAADPAAAIPAAVPAVTPFRAGKPSGISPETAAPLPKFSGTYTLLADCSEWEPNINDAAYLAWSKAIVIRAAFGDQHDDAAWYGGARRADLHSGGAAFIGIYQFLVSGQDGTAQANTLHALVGPLQKGEVLIADFEQGGKAMLTAWYNQMLALGYADKYLWTYTGLYFSESSGVLPVQWLADYTSTEPAEAHTLWQFTDSYPVPGVGTCDCSVYHGDIAELVSLAYAAPAGTTAAPAPAPAAPEWPAGGALAYGSSGAAVTALQTALRDSGIRGARGIAVDGQFGTQTQAAVNNFEAAEKLAADGIAGPQVRAALVRLGRLTASGQAVT